MSRFSRFIDDFSHRRYPREVEGFAKASGLGENQLLMCGSMDGVAGTSIADFRGLPAGQDGTLPGWVAAYGNRRAVEWETSPAPGGAPGGEAVFTWIGGSQTRPLRQAFPYATAKLFVDGTHRLSFALGWPNIQSVVVDGFMLAFEPRRFASQVTSVHRQWEPNLVAGFYRLTVPAAHLKEGRPVRLRVEIEPPPAGSASMFFVSPRTDALSLSLATMRDELAQLQADVVRLERSHEMLYAQSYPELFPNRLRGERVIAWQHELNHYHPATITVLESGEAIITAREANDHLDIDGRIVISRSRDGGRTWSAPEALIHVPKADHRCSPIFELPDGEWVTTDYRAGSLYDKDGLYKPLESKGPTLWSAWSRDGGKTWGFSERPITVPGMNPYAEAERHMIRLPSGRLLLAANYAPYKSDGTTTEWGWFGVAVHASDDNARTWRCLTKLPEDNRVTGEPTLIRTRSGRIILLMRTEVVQNKDFTRRGMLLQSVSEDDGQTWSPLQDTQLSSMSAPAHLLQLRDGRLLVSHNSRSYPGSILVTTSSDEGRTWDTARTRVVASDLPNDDSCYATSGQLPDGTILTAWYGNLFSKFFVAVMRYPPDNL